MQVSPYSILFLTLAAIVLVLLVLTGRASKRNGARQLFFFYCASLLALSCMAVSLCTSGLEAQTAWHEAKYIGYAYIPLATMSVYLSICGKRGVTRRNLVWHLIFPTVTVFMAVVNPGGLFRREMHLDISGGHTFAMGQGGPWFYIHHVYAYLLLTVAIVTVIRTFAKAPRLYRGPYTILLVGLGIAFVLNVVAQFGLVPDYSDITLVASTLASFFAYRVVFLYKPKRMIRMARDMMVNDAHSMILTFDRGGYLLDANNKARAELGLSDGDMGRLDIERFRTEHLRGCVSPEITLREHVWKVSDRELVDNRGCLAGMVFVLDDITALKKTIAELDVVASRDYLTGLRNRHAFHNQLREMDSPDKLPICLIVCNLRGLKLLNTTFGNEYGDEVVRAAARVIEEACYGEALCARMDGDEFAMAIPHTTGVQGAGIVSEISDALARGHATPGRPPITASFGVTTKKETRQNLDILLKNAVNEMYANKLLESGNSSGATVEAFRQSLLSLEGGEEQTPQMRALAVRLGEALGLNEAAREQLVLLLEMHNIGLLSVPTYIASSVGRLSNIEWESYKLHAAKGQKIAMTIPELVPLADAIRGHHERWDGLGYPDRLAREQIPRLARIHAVLSAYSRAVLVQGKSDEEAMRHLQKSAGSSLDPNIVTVLEGLERIGAEITQEAVPSEMLEQEVSALPEVFDLPEELREILPDIATPSGASETPSLEELEKEFLAILEE